MQPHRNAPRKREGNAALELAITLPVMVTIVFGSVEICGQTYAKQAVEAVAYECASVAAEASAPDAQVRDRMSQLLDQRGIRGGTVTTNPATIERVPRGTRITVTIAAPAASNTLVPLRFVSQPDIEARCVMLKEL